MNWNIICEQETTISDVSPSLLWLELFSTEHSHSHLHSHKSFYSRGKSQMISTLKRHGKYEMWNVFGLFFFSCLHTICKCFPSNPFNGIENLLLRHFICNSLSIISSSLEQTYRFGWAFLVSFAWNNMYVLESDICFHFWRFGKITTQKWISFFIACTQAISQLINTTDT